MQFFAQRGYGISKNQVLLLIQASIKEQVQQAWCREEGVLQVTLIVRHYATSHNHVKFLSCARASENKQQQI